MLTITKLAEPDRLRWQELFRGYNAFYERTLPDETYDRAWREVLRDTRWHALGARYDDELVGIAHFLVHPSTTAADVCYLQDLFTAPEARGRGVGRALIQEVTTWARSRRCSRVYWSTHESNAQARHLYDQVAVNLGFIRYQLDL